MPARRLSGAAGGAPRARGVRGACLALLAAWLLAGCATVDYLGVSYGPYPKHHPVDVFFSRESVERPHIVIGRALGRDELGASLDDIVTELRATARAVGADGIVVTAMRQEHGSKFQVEAEFVRYK